MKDEEIITINQALENAIHCPIRNKPICRGDGTDIDCFFCTQSTMSKSKKQEIIEDMYRE